MITHLHEYVPGHTLLAAFYWTIRDSPVNSAYFIHNGHQEK